MAAHQTYLIALESFTHLNDYYLHELADMYQGLEAEVEELTETGNYVQFFFIIWVDWKKPFFFDE